MRRRSPILILFVLLGFGVSLGFPAEDVLDNVYDESEAVPYEAGPLFSIVAPLEAARTTRVPSRSCPRLITPSLFASKCVPDTDAKRPANARISLSLLHILLC
jgi:hypothetical protein